MVMALAPYFFRTAFWPRYMAAEVTSVSRVTPSTRAAVFSQRSAMAADSSLSAAAQASLTSAKGTSRTSMPISDLMAGAMPGQPPPTARIFDSLIFRRQSSVEQTASASAATLRSPGPGVDERRTAATRAPKSPGAPLLLTFPKAPQAATRSSGREDATKPRLFVFLRRKSAV